MRIAGAIAMMNATGPYTEATISRRRDVIRPRSRVAAVALAAALLPAVAACTATGPVPTRSATPVRARTTPSASSGPSAAVGTVERSFSVVPADRTVIAAAGAGVLYAAVDRGEADADWRISRLDLASGAVVQHDVHLPGLRTLTIGPDGLYLATSMIDRYGSTPDTLLRLDPSTLRPLAERVLQDHALWDGDVHLAASGDTLAEMDGGGAIRLLDPRTFATERSIQVLSRSDQLAGDDIESPILRRGRLWVLAHHDVLAFALPTLRQVASTAQGGYGWILGTGGGLVLVGVDMALLGDEGKVTPLPAVAGVDGATAGAEAAFAVGDDIAEQADDTTPRIVLRDDDGRSIGVRELDPDTGVLLAGADDVLWAQGVAGSTSAITAIRIR